MNRFLAAIVGALVLVTTPAYAQREPGNPNLDVCITKDSLVNDGLSIYYDMTDEEVDTLVSMGNMYNVSDVVVFENKVNDMAVVFFGDDGCATTGFPTNPENVELNLNNIRQNMKGI